MSDLPKWTKKEQFTDRNWGLQMDRYQKALGIAWEALEWHTRSDYPSKIAKDAMRRISELGEK